MGATFTVDEATKNVTIKVDEYEILKVGSDFVFSNVPVTLYAFLGVKDGEFYVNTNTAVLRSEAEVMDYKKDFDTVVEAYEALQSLFSTEEYKLEAGVSGDSKRRRRADSRKGKKIPMWMKKA